MAEDLAAIYAELKARMLRATPNMVVAEDGPGGVVLHAPWPNPAHPKQAMWFGRVEPRKTYVAFHLMPVYSHPELLEGMSPALKKRMSGKSCFNFAKMDEQVFDEIEALAGRSAARYAEPFELKR